MSEDYHDGFAWAVPTAFNDALSQARFEEGDMLYNCRDGYRVWSEALKHLHYSIQVKSPSHAIGKATDEAGVFEENWRSRVVFTLTDYKTGESREVTSTQGRLFTLLWKGNLEILSADPEPQVPLTCFTLLRKADSVASEVREYFASTYPMSKPNIFVMTYDPTHFVSQTKCEAVSERLRNEFEVVEQKFAPCELGLGHLHIVPTVGFIAFAVDLRASGKMSDILKEVLYKPSGSKKTSADRFRLSTHGVFMPHHTPDYGDLVTISFSHGKGGKNLFYRYRLQKPRLQNAPPELRDFLTSLMVDCPNHLFSTPPFCSKLKLELPIKCERIRDHELTDLAGASFANRQYKSEHENVQMHLLQNDPKTLAVEIPVWIEWSELSVYARHVSPCGTLTGHIDIVRLADGFVELWDYKPAAFQETTASAQLFYYALMLSTRTGIPFSKFRCGYFDPSNAFLFDPEVAMGVVASALPQENPKVPSGSGAFNGNVKA